MGGPEATRDHHGVSPSARALLGAFALLHVASAVNRLDAQVTALPVDAAPVPWKVGERFGYDVKFGFIKAGSAEMTVAGVESVRGRAAWRARFTVRGGYLLLRVDDVLETWMDAITLSSLRFSQELSEIGRDRQKVFDIFPERGTYIQHGKPEKPSVPAPLDDGSFLFFIRTVPLEVGQTYEFNRYFIPDRNPVKVRVLRRERVSVPAGHVRVHRAAAHHQDEGHLLGGRPGRDLADGRSAAHHGADEIQAPVRIAQSLSARRERHRRAGGGPVSTPREADLSRVRTVPVGLRPNKVNAGEFATPCADDRSFAAFVRSLPDVLKARDFRRVVDAVVQAARAKRAVIVMLGGHVVKTGVGPCSWT